MCWAGLVGGLVAVAWTLGGSVGLAGTAQVPLPSSTP